MSGERRARPDTNYQLAAAPLRLGATWRLTRALRTRDAQKVTSSRQCPCRFGQLPFVNPAVRTAPPRTTAQKTRGGLWSRIG